MGKKKAAGKAAGDAKNAPRCPVDGCRTRLTAEKAAKCETCGLNVCTLHKYPTDHTCKTAAPVAPKNGGGLTIVSNKSKKSDKQSEEEKRKAEARDEALLSKLVEISSEDLLKELLAFGASSARYESSVAVQALCSEAKAVQKSMFGAVGQGVMETAKASGDLDKLAGALTKHLSEAASAKRLSSDEEQRAVGVATLLGMALDAEEGETRAKSDETLELGKTLVRAPYEKLAKAGASEVLKRAAKARWSNGRAFEEECWPLLGSLVDEVLKVPEEDDSLRNGLAYAIAAVAGGCGEIAAGQPLVDGKLAPVLDKPKKIAPILACMRTMLVLTKEWGTAIMPYLMPVDFLQKSLFDVYDNTASNGRSATKKVILQIVDKMGPRGVRLSVPIFMDGLEHASWRVKAMSLQCLGALGKQRASQLFRDLPILIPAVMECVRDTKKQVSDAASDALDSLGELVSNAETIKLLPWLLNALKDPEQVDPCLDELMDTTFVNSVDAQSLAFIIPVVLRGLREGTADVKLKASITAGNVCSLVADVHDMRPYYTHLLPELKKLTDHSRPRVREMALRAKNSLQEDLSMTRRRSSQNSGGGSAAAAAAAVAAVGVGGSGNAADAASDAQAGEVLESKLKAAGLFDLLGEVAFDYVLSTCRMLMFDLLEDVDQEMPRKLVYKRARAQTEEGVQPFVAHCDDAEQTRLLDAATSAVVDALWVAQGKQDDDGGDGEDSEKDYIVFIPSIILAFASRVLLKRAGLFLERGHRYSVVGLNGTGKSTLLTRVAARDIDGFPDDITVYFVQHEIVEDEQQLNVIDYMQHDVKSQVQSKENKKRKGGKKFEDLYDLSMEHMLEVLREVGFTDTLLQQQVSALSGGWKMRLAIARSMLYMPDLLLLDEPTNHLDAAALDWLQKYLAGLEGTTIVLVSHDYDFVDYVATDIIHLADQKLAYYPFGFTRFQQERPEIVAALPKKDDNAKKDGEEGGNAGLSAIELMAKAATDENAAALTSGIKPIRFPEGSKLEGVTHRGKPVAQLTKVTYGYPGTDKIIFNDVTVKLTLNSRVAILGPNGAGKSTLLKLLVGELELDEKHGHLGKYWKHHNLRTAYISQHSLHHLENHLEATPCQYIQDRFFEGRDKEASKMITVKLEPEDKEAMERSGEICEIISRVVRSKKLYYEVRKNGRAEKGANRDMRSLEELEKMSVDHPHVIKLVRLFDEELKFAASGADLRPVTTPEFIKHLAEFGIDSEIAQRKVRWMSGGQRARLVLAAAMWTCPHMIILDEPTNYLDQDTVAALTYALKTFRGSVVLISHHQGFVDAVANEKWHLENGTLRVESLKTDKK
ncbi:ABC transporter ATP-binding protein [Hondaea fermentalgiana]|uniref:ABC transporter ATP-binding protein n=1 Tax=Hondaea fermentalgiana TaxID=2315210 RepID=A0A2R5GEJ5_9STRA|nr:ABC transporter ATP-binding protein [Hondaea fermentalgiana]|eukprot:GBG29342.1 ABC transporter ATP-binding protein [Hondaea fermentalgiana]